MSDKKTPRRVLTCADPTNDNPPRYRGVVYDEQHTDPDLWLWFTGDVLPTADRAHERARAIAEAHGCVVVGVL